LQANAWLARKIHDFELWNFPEDWTDVVTNFFTENFRTQYEMKSTEPKWKIIENRLQSTLPDRQIKSIKVIQNIFLWKKYQLEFDTLKKKLRVDP
jgi:hypothetical protein